MRLHALILVACLALVLGCPQKEKKEEETSGAVASSARFSESFSSPTKLVTVRYPPEFAAQNNDENSIILAHNLPDGLDEAIAFVSVEEPISNELKEFARVVENAAKAQLENYEKQSGGRTTCNGQPGIEARTTWESGGVVYRRRSCAFLHNGHGFFFSYSLPEKHAKRERLLRAIVESVTFRAE